MSALVAPARPDGGPWSLRHRLRVAFTAVGVMLVVMSAIALYAAYKFVATGNEVIYRWQRAGLYSVRVLDDYVNQETGLRGFELTRDERSLQPYRDYTQRAADDLGRVRTYVSGDADLERQLHTVEQAADTWRREIAEPAIAQVRAGGQGDLSTQLDAMARFDEFRQHADTLTAALKSRSEATRSERTTDGLIAGIVAGLGLLMIGVSGFVLWLGLGRWVLQPMTWLAGQTRKVRSGATHQSIVAIGPVELIDLGADVESMRLQIAGQLDEAERSRETLRVRSDELARSNDDLQQFAYVASHDLSEPLRKVANFCQLLERQYAPQLDDRAGQYIHYAVDGARRMQVLITDLLALSRVGRSTERFEWIQLDRKLDQALDNLSDKIEESGAEVERLTPMPVVRGDRSLIVSLLENLIGNAVKYRREDVSPIVRISAELDEQAHMWTFTVSDNGIGIDHEFAEKIFAVFQRLHLRDQYGGTGIGLALVRKIVEFHGGRIWLSNVQSGTGATFQFTLPEGEQHAESRD